MEDPFDDEFDFLVGEGEWIMFFFEEGATANVLEDGGATGVAVGFGGVAIAWVVITGWGDDEVLIDVICD